MRPQWLPLLLFAACQEGAEAAVGSTVCETWGKEFTGTDYVDNTNCPTVGGNGNNIAVMGTLVVNTLEEGVVWDLGNSGRTENIQLYLNSAGVLEIRVYTDGIFHQIAQTAGQTELVEGTEYRVALQIRDFDGTVNGWRQTNGGTASAMWSFVNQKLPGNRYPPAVPRDLRVGGGFGDTPPYFKGTVKDVFVYNQRITGIDVTTTTSTPRPTTLTETATTSTATATTSTQSTQTTTSVTVTSTSTRTTTLTTSSSSSSSTSMSSTTSSSSSSSSSRTSTGTSTTTQTTSSTSSSVSSSTTSTTSSRTSSSTSSTSSSSSRTSSSTTSITLTTATTTITTSMTSLTTSSSTTMTSTSFTSTSTVTSSSTLTTSTTSISSSSTTATGSSTTATGSSTTATSSSATATSSSTTTTSTGTTTTSTRTTATIAAATATSTRTTATITATTATSTRTTETITPGITSSPDILSESDRTGSTSSTTSTSTGTLTLTSTTTSTTPAELTAVPSDSGTPVLSGLDNETAPSPAEADPSGANSAATSSLSQRVKSVVQTATRSLIPILKTGAVTTLSVETEWGKASVTSVDALRAAPQLSHGNVQVLDDGHSKIVLSQALLNSLPSGSYVSQLLLDSDLTQLLLDAVGGNDQAIGKALAAVSTPDTSSQITLAIDISILDSRGSPVEIEQPILFQLPDKLPEWGGVPTTDPTCSYVANDGPVAVWATSGVRRATNQEISDAGQPVHGLWCMADHLTVFSALAEALTGCLNIELWSLEAADAMLVNTGWWKSGPSVLIFSIAGALVCFLCLGLLRELWAVRLGWMPQTEGEAVSVCRRFMAWGPQLIKHKYAAFLVFAKEVFQCVRAGRSKLRNPTLVAGVQRSLAYHTGISLGCITQCCWGCAAWLESPASLPRTVFLQKLDFHAGLAEKVIKTDLRGSGMCQVLHRLWITIVTTHPVLSAIRVGSGGATVLKRAVMQIGTTFGVLGTYSIILQYSGSLRSWESDADCVIEPSSHFYVFIATLASIACNAVPNAFLADLAQQIHGRAAWNVVWWILMLIYLTTAVFTVVLALANLNQLDQETWYTALEWAMAIRFVGLPIAQALKTSIMLEFFLGEESAPKREKRFMAALGLRSYFENPLPDEAQETVEKMARQAISAEDLVNFTALLGEKVMLDFDPELSTSAEVIEGAVRPLCAKPPSLDQYPVSVEVVKVRGLQAPNQGHKTESHLSCSIIHLGAQMGLHRPCLHEHRSSASLAATDGSLRHCCWCFEASVTGLGLENALGFEVTDCGRVVGVACLPAEEVLRDGGYEGELILHPPKVSGTASEANITPRSGEPSRWSKQIENKVPFLVPTQTASVATHNFTASKGQSKASLGISQLARLSVKVRLPLGYLQTLALHSRRQLMRWQPQDQSEVPEDPVELQNYLIRMVAEQSVDTGRCFSQQSHLSCGAFCEPAYDKPGVLPPDRLVVHSRQGKYIDMVTTVIANALGDAGAYRTVYNHLVSKEYGDILDALREAGGQHRRYWIDMFSTDVVEGNWDLIENNEGDHCWHEELMAALPSVAREMKQACCLQMMEDVAQGKEPSCGLPQQLLVLDQEYSLLEDPGCLCEMMLLRSLRFSQRLVLHPHHLRGRQLGNALGSLAEALGEPFFGGELPWSDVYLEDRQFVYDTLRDLIVDAVKVHKEDHEQTWSELNLTDIYATIGASLAFQRSRTDAQHEEVGGADDVGMDAGDMDMDF